MLGSSNSASETARPELAAAARVLATGGVVVYPTETVYGLGADAFNPAALQRLVALKVRAPGKPIAVLIADVEMLHDLVTDVPAIAQRLMRQFWPGPLTLVMRAQPAVSPLLTGTSDGVGVRVSSHAIATALVVAVGRPITTPSANPADRPPSISIDAAREYFGAQVDCYVDGGTLPGEPASTVVDVRAGWSLIREGAIPANRIRAVVDESV